VRRDPLLFQLNTRTRLTALSVSLGRAATLDDIGDAELDGWASQGFDWLWPLGVWSTGLAGRAVSRADQALRAELREVLPDLTEADICGSCFAVTAYTVAPALGGPAALARLRARLAARGIRLLLDFVGNHTAPDHPWVQSAPDRFVHGTAADLAQAPANYIEVQTGAGPAILAHGRDPYFPGWPDTLQLDYANPATAQAMHDAVLEIAAQCDGVRCDMAMLLLPDVFRRTWGLDAAPFWPAAIAAVRARQPDFLFMAEVYWGLEDRLLAQGFDRAYDKTLYDRLVARDAAGARAHLAADLPGRARFLENHDEPRAAATFPPEVHRPAAALTFLSPGLRLIHQGQMQGARLHVSVHVCRAPVESVDPAISDFYARLMPALSHPAAGGTWTLLDCTAAWDGNWTHDRFVAFLRDSGDALLLVVANYADNQGQCYVRLPVARFAGRTVRLRDLLGPAAYDRSGDDLLRRGLYLDLPPWGHHAFDAEVA
jgi:hypothetical protein